ncbi:hypothetical protein CGCA056_v006906 [Colletotrichum aenigma]|uniref:uncharacterized protein n=1 Tax=Colletotrichum aenigma TaxID=1215731 RepID=UPI0018731831|nr:uncharacterized protein CGCA056_v006906 [Colletotrichum aenigma]KAF5522174.1 hypothetical protein CGCA056_v006906 [Colletotrichum aenigma]
MQLQLQLSGWPASTELERRREVVDNLVPYLSVILCLSQVSRQSWTIKLMWGGSLMAATTSNRSSFSLCTPEYCFPVLSCCTSQRQTPIFRLLISLLSELPSPWLIKVAFALPVRTSYLSCPTGKFIILPSSSAPRSARSLKAVSLAQTRNPRSLFVA